MRPASPADTGQSTPDVSHHARSQMQQRCTLVDIEGWTPGRCKLADEGRGGFLMGVFPLPSHTLAAALGQRRIAQSAEAADSFKTTCKN